MRRSADLLVFASGDAISEAGVENGALGCEAARRISSCMGVFRLDLLREYRNFPGAGVSLVGLGFDGPSSWTETLCIVFFYVGSAMEVIKIDIKLTRSGAGDSGSPAQDGELCSSFLGSSPSSSLVATGPLLGFISERASLSTG